MSLQLYNRKRNFRRTPEPAGKRAADSRNKQLLFVIQKHEASHLHYDFRLELDGVLLSWAVPKGPSLNPDDKRLAMHVEDHPMDYRTFEGIIPAGEYGGGTVMVWDEGTYHADPKADRETNQKLLREGYRKGKLTFTMVGKKLRGEFSLVRMRGRNSENNAWLLIKSEDGHADRERDVRDLDRSAVSRRAMEEIAGDADKVWQAGGEAAEASKRKKAAKGPALRMMSPGLKPKTLAKAALAAGGKESPAPTISGPQLATLVDAPFDREGWIFEIKWDGYRTLGFHPAQGGRTLVSRNGKSFDESFRVIRDALQSLPCEAIVDGEVVALDKEGKSSFMLLQNHEENAASLVYYIFDLLYVDGVDVRQLPLLERKKLLKRLLDNVDERLQYSDHVETEGLAFFEAARKGGLEGIIAKDGAAAYQTDARTRHWLKVKLEQRQEFIIAGYTDPRASRSHLGSLVLAYYGREGRRKGKLQYAGHVGSGMDEDMRAELKERLDALAVKSCPFDAVPKTNEKAHWVKPQLVCEVRYTEKTADCHLRHPVFIELRFDKPARQIFWDIAQDVQVAVHAAEQDDAAEGTAPARRKRATKTAAADTPAKKSPAKPTPEKKPPPVKEPPRKKVPLKDPPKKQPAIKEPEREPGIKEPPDDDKPAIREPGQKPAVHMAAKGRRKEKAVTRRAPKAKIKTRKKAATKARVAPRKTRAAR